MTKYSNICEPNLCNGCLACYNSCKHNAIELKEDILHFITPVINNEKCIDCGLCRKRCQIINPHKDFHKAKCSYALYSKDKTIHDNSASGGASYLLLKEILRNNGIVYGVHMPSINEIFHKRIENIEDLTLIQGSKYVQSNIGNTYIKVKEDLINGRFVAFTGTPCQIGGLLKYLNKEYNNLITIELVCHGIASIGLLKDEVATIIKKQNLSDLKVTFRDKIKGEGIIYGLKINDNNKILYYNRKNIFIQCFKNNLFLRESCYYCSYAKPSRLADITICDFWGLKKQSDKSFKDENGISGVLVNTEKGQILFDKCLDSFNYLVRPYNELINGNGATRRPPERPISRNLLLKRYKSFNINEIGIKAQKILDVHNKTIYYLKKIHLIRVYTTLLKVIYPLAYNKKYYNIINEK